MTIHTGDCIEVMAAMEPDSVDAVVTDPPYGLEFMGKGWDAFRPAMANRGGKAPGRSQRDDTKLAPVEYGIGGRRSTMVCDSCGKRDKFTNPHTCEDATWSRLFLDDDPRHAAYGQSFQAWCEAWGREALRVTKPGGYLLAFGGTRTHHRLVCGLEDAGWIIRDELTWIYASGFPKGKANLKPAHEPIVLARKPGPLRPLAIDECRIGTAVENWPTSRPYAPGGNQTDDGERIYTQTETGPPPSGRWPSNLLLSDPELFDQPNPEVVGSGAVVSSTSAVGAWAPRGAFPIENPNPVVYGDSGGYSRFYLIPKSSRSDREPVLKDAAVLLHQARGECDKLGASTSSTSPARATSEAITKDASPSAMSRPGRMPTDPSPLATSSTTSTATSRTTDSPISSSLTPLPTSASILAASSATENGGSPAESADNSSLWGESTGISAGKDGPSTDGAGRAMFGSSSKRNRCAACGKQLPRVSTHPTQKPTDLMAHLIKLVTPTDGVVLDPFLGSGSTAIAAERLGVQWVGIEKEPEYVAIAEARLNGTQRGLGLDVPAPTRKQGKIGVADPTARGKRGRAANSGFKGQWAGTPEEVA